MFRTKCKEHDHSSFYKFLQMEHNHKNLDCYFFYYSTCKKGDFCPYRHEPSALGCETICTYWQQGNCLNEHCNFRHMELKKNRKSIPCYWETQPGGCRKPHCPFMHTTPRALTSDPINPVKTTEVATKSPNPEWLNRQDDPKYDGSSTTESDQGRGNSEAGSFIGSPVDPLIVKFEEESDNESVPSPVKAQPKIPYCKTYEQMRLEEIQAESAAYYSYDDENYIGLHRKQADVGKGKNISTKRGNKWICVNPVKNETKKLPMKLDFEVLSLEEIRRRKKEKELAAGTSATTSESPPPSAEARGAKRRSAEHCSKESTSPPKKRRFSSEFIQSSQPAIKVSPVKLRRSLKSATTTTTATTTGETEAQCRVVAMSERGTAGDQSEELCRENRLENVGDNSAGVSRRGEVEVRLCDSSTKEEKTQTQSVRATEDRKSVATYTTEDIMGNVLFDGQPYTQTEEEYLRLDTTDIMRDIEDLLK